MTKRTKKEANTPMHETTARLYEAAVTLRKVEAKPGPVSRLIHSSLQTVKNWEARGVSQKGMSDAQKYIGCSATWIRDGKGPMVIGELFVQQEPSAESGLADALKLTCETAAELQLLSVFRLANKDEREFISIAIENIRARLRREVFGDDPQ